MDLEKVYNKLFDWCELREFAGADPFDGLNSAIFQATPFKRFAIARLVWLQMVKHSAKDLRPLLKVPPGVNSKGIALFALAELSRVRVTKNDQHAAKAKGLLAKLLELKIQLPDGKIAFGYNFDWQSRAFFAPRGTPTIVPTAFVYQAFIEGYELFGEQSYLETADGICRFIVEDLNRPHETENEVCFSYTPLDKSVIYNASLLAGECLASYGNLTQNTEYIELATKTARFVLRGQNESGAWAYGPKLRHKWVDNFHTAYVLQSLYCLQKSISALQIETEAALNLGYKFWLENFFLDDGTPRYFADETYPVDIHSAAAAIVALSELSEIFDDTLPMARKVAGWTIANMLDEDGHFYYQKRQSKVIKTPFMRWGQGWMAHALARLIEAENREL